MSVNLTVLPEQQWQVIPQEELEKEIGLPKFYDIMMAAKRALNDAIPEVAGNISLSNYLIRPLYAPDFLWPPTIASGSLDPTTGATIASTQAGTPVYSTFEMKQGYGAGSNTNKVSFQFQLPDNAYMVMYGLTNLAATPLTVRLDVGVNQKNPEYSFILDNLYNYESRTGVLVMKESGAAGATNVFPVFDHTDTVTLTFWNATGNGATSAGVDLLQIRGFIAKPAGSSILSP